MRRDSPVSQPTPEDHERLQAEVAELKEELAATRADLDRLSTQMSRVLDAALAAGAVRPQEGRPRLWRVPAAVTATALTGFGAARRFTAAHPAPVAIVVAGIVGAVVFGAITRPWADGGGDETPGVPPAAGPTLTAAPTTPLPSPTPPSPRQTGPTVSPNMPAQPVMTEPGGIMPVAMSPSPTPSPLSDSPERDVKAALPEPEPSASPPRCLLRLEVDGLPKLALLCH